MQLPAVPLYLCAAVGAGPPLWVQWEEVGVLLLPGSFLLGSHATVYFEVRRLLFCFSGSASRTCTSLLLVKLLLQGLYPLPELLIISNELFEVLDAHRHLPCRAGF